MPVTRDTALSVLSQHRLVAKATSDSAGRMGSSPRPGSGCRATPAESHTGQNVMWMVATRVRVLVENSFFEISISHPYSCLLASAQRCSLTQGSTMVDLWCIQQCFIRTLVSSVPTTISSCVLGNTYQMDEVFECLCSLPNSDRDFCEPTEMYSKSPSCFLVHK